MRSCASNSSRARAAANAAIETRRVDFQRSLARVMKLPSARLGQANRDAFEPEPPRDVSREECDGIRRVRRQQNVARQIEQPRELVASRRRFLSRGRRTWADRWLATILTASSVNSATQFSRIGDRPGSDGRQKKVVEAEKRHERRRNRDPSRRNRRDNQHDEQKRKRDNRGIRDAEPRRNRAAVSSANRIRGR